MVSVSPRLRDSLDYEEPEATDPRFSLGFRSLDLATNGYDQYELQYDHRPFSGFPKTGAIERKRRRRQSDQVLDYAVPFQYRTTADGEAFRLALLLPGTGTSPVECRLIWESSKRPKREYACLSYCWETVERTTAILCDGYRFPITKNLLMALQKVRKPTIGIHIWIDQICINQDDYQERAHQVSIMKYIFSNAKEVIVWLGEAGDRSAKLCEYARRMARGQHAPNDRYSPKSALNRIMNQRQLQDALQRLLERPWFKRVWVIPEVALSHFSVVAIGDSTVSWDNLVRLIRDTQLPQSAGFDKQTALLGNPRQRIAIITQMSASQSKGLFHTDIMQLLILAKSSQATDVRDKVYAFYGVTLLRTHPYYGEIPDRKTSIERLYVEIACHYVNSILYDDYYSRWHGLNEARRTQQLMSILYSAGRLHQHHNLPSWVPDWTYAWYQAPLWCKTESNLATLLPRDDWSAGIRSDHRAGGERRETFEIIDAATARHQLRVSALIFDSILETYEATPAMTLSEEHGPLEPSDSATALHSPTLSYGRDFFKTTKGFFGMATRGIRQNDTVVLLLGGDVPFVLRAFNRESNGTKTFMLLCECYVQANSVMVGDYMRTEWSRSEDITIL
ncbi:hypothetical protein BAUCODRAFT_32462 [Baudoinia panamericana UAMH 10762]|uniref:Heterokaryon incompatibility domain-containing protein n=1 Tax=Baudoinia panamericana (strain UAMH 10762) TaxID=717646 RepID=M2LUY7_BAUPA|nr:uncharacterized protein BAUCODRAFT_32462 [Baudoinia panamericana UAMH 10762]EMC98427.1 hypothetical protein BAUCODRAFT_32462 [Baudoinia panamericana UAMH 10762]